LWGTGSIAGEGIVNEAVDLRLIRDVRATEDLLGGRLLARRPGLGHQRPLESRLLWVGLAETQTVARCEEQGGRTGTCQGTDKLLFRGILPPEEVLLKAK